MMDLPEPRAAQYRTAAMSLIVVAALGAFRVAITWIDPLIGPLTVPLLVAFVIFNAGHVWAGTKVRYATTGAKLGASAVALNFLTIVLPPVSPLFWAAVSSIAVALALAGAVFLLKDARRARA